MFHDAEGNWRITYNHCQVFPAWSIKTNAILRFISISFFWFSLSVADVVVIVAEKNNKKKNRITSNENEWP